MLILMLPKLFRGDGVISWPEEVSAHLAVWTCPAGRTKCRMEEAGIVIRLTPLRLQLVISCSDGFAELRAGITCRRWAP